MSKLFSKLTVPLLALGLFFTATSYDGPCALAQNGIPSTPFDAASWLETNHCSVQRNGQGQVTGVVLSYIAVDFVLGKLDVFPELESIEINYSSRIRDNGISGLERLKKVKRLVFTNCDNISEASISVLNRLPSLEEFAISNCDSLSSIAALRSCTGLKRIRLQDCDSLNFASLKNVLSGLDLESVELIRNPLLLDEHVGLLAGATTLTELAITDCSGVTDQGLEVLANLKQLKKLDLRNCTEITGAGLQNVSPDLETLNLSGAGFDPTGSVHLSRLENLKELRFSDASEFTAADLNFLGASEDLEILELRNVPIDDSHLQRMAGCRKLKTLSLVNCEGVTGMGLEYLRDSTGLEKLVLHDCRRIDSPDMQAVAGFRNLRHLNLNGSRVRADGIAHLAPLQKLRFLSLSHCKWVDDDCLEQLNVLESLETIQLNGVRRITDRGLELLGQLPNLKKLTISKNREITGAGFAGFAENSPLKSLTMLELDFLKPAGLQSLANLQQLERLEIKCKNLANEHILALQGIPKLKSFDFDEMEKVDQEIYRRFVLSLPSYDN